MHSKEYMPFAKGESLQSMFDNLTNLKSNCKFI